ncbi:hypothetical protein P171DRAFT_110562 [Karstenula rhodostoma CBS 690.94]|uniref:Uncharacterized protein n=1 Tax=Karstenula rhodostoma CBS 690.94 TaxID=1392251 RepID=A0A9P4U872_9PLEO|nr:hypothetical protein P171DRAFT_110562 [Karstenula rhodostoma CBS 690.94]
MKRKHQHVTQVSRPKLGSIRTCCKSGLWVLWIRSEPVWTLRTCSRRLKAWRRYAYADMPIWRLVRATDAGICCWASGSCSLRPQARQIAAVCSTPRVKLVDVANASHHTPCNRERDAAHNALAR